MDQQSDIRLRPSSLKKRLDIVARSRGLKKPRFVSRKKLLSDYKRSLRLKQIAKMNRISVEDLRRLLAAYRITREQLLSLRTAGQRAAAKKPLIAQYHMIRKKLGYHPTTNELQYRSKAWRRLCGRIIYVWGSFQTFRKDLGIPTSPQRLASLRQRFARK